MKSFLESWRRDIRAARSGYVADATAAVEAAGHPADVVRRAAFLAGLEWDEAHPTHRSVTS